MLSNENYELRGKKMNIILILACLAAFYNATIMTYNKDYLSLQQTNNWKGICIVLVIFHHLNIFAGVGDVYNIFGNVGYIAVGGFLFISGYGLMFQFASKGSEYIKKFLKKRILTVIIPAFFMSGIYYVIKWRIEGYSFGNMRNDFLGGGIRHFERMVCNGNYIFLYYVFYSCHYNLDH